jgi:hypothetical protein
MRHPPPLLPLALVLSAALVAAGCGQSSTPPESASAPPVDEVPVVEAPAETAGEEAAADLATREQELAAQAEELARREAELAEREAAAQQAAQAKPASKPAPVARPPAAAKPAPAPAPVPAPVAAEPPAPPPPPVTVPVGTELAVEFPATLTTKTTNIGEPVTARLASDLVVDGRRVAGAGSTIRGSVTESTSGSKKIGARPLLRVEFTELVLADGTTAAINARAVQRGDSEKGRDTAKIAGGTAAGAILGHQIDDDKGKVIGGVIGGAAGAIAASKTDTEAEIAAGTVMPAALRTAFEYRGP